MAAQPVFPLMPIPSDNARPEGPGFTPVEKLKELTPRQKKEVRAQNRPSAALIHETIRSEGIGELERTAGALAISGLAAGLSMGFSLVVQGELNAALAPGAAQSLIGPLGYTVGFLIVVLGRQQLFTENTLTPVLPLLHDRSVKTFIQLLKLWAVVLASNVVGAALFAWFIASAPLFEPHTIQSFLALGRETVKSDFAATFFKAVMAGWLIALMVWLLPAAETARAFIIIALAYVVALGKFSHIIAGSVECAFLVASGGTNVAEFFARFFAPTLLGNIVGGVALVAFLNYGQVAREIEEHDGAG